MIGEYVLAPNGANYSQADYFAESAELQAIYDDTELRELNAARNTFDAITTAGDGIGLVEGRIIDTAGNPIAGVTVDILRTEDGVLLYRTATGEDGSFSIFVYLEDVEYSFLAGQVGVVWEVADLNGGQVTYSQRVYSSLTGKRWWLDSKWVLDLEECESLKWIL